MNMESIIKDKLIELEEKENIKIIYACESGSRAWGFASPDSDYDVRFIYVRDSKFYLKLEKTRDVIELPISDVLDINGWDIDKTLKLLMTSNPTLYEWFNSPIVYRNSGVADGLKVMAKDYFVPKKALYHYLNMAKNTEKAYLRDDMVKAKKYFYVFRPILAAEWIIDNKSAPPILFSELVESKLPKHLIPFIEELLEIKMKSPELKLIPRIKELDEYIKEEFDRIEKIILEYSNDRNENWEELNEFFLSLLL